LFYECEIKLKAFKNKMRGKISGRRKGEVKGGQKEFGDQKLHELFFSP
jgi:hypothetical protein